MSDPQCIPRLPPLPLSRRTSVRSPTISSIKSASSTPARTYMKSPLGPALYQKTPQDAYSKGLPVTHTSMVPLKTEPGLSAFSEKGYAGVPVQSFSSDTYCYYNDPVVYPSEAKETLIQGKTPYYPGSQPYLSSSVLSSSVAQMTIPSYVPQTPSGNPLFTSSSTLSTLPLATVSQPLQSRNYLSSPPNMGPYGYPSYLNTYQEVPASLPNPPAQPLYTDPTPLQSQRVMQMLYMLGEQEKQHLKEKLSMERKQHELELENKNKNFQLSKQKDLIEKLTMEKKAIKMRMTEKEKKEKEDHDEEMEKELRKNMKEYTEQKEEEKQEDV